MSLELMDCLPYNTVFLHAMVNFVVDEREGGRETGRKMEQRITQ